MIFFWFLANSLPEIFNKDWKLLVSIFYIFVTITWQILFLSPVLSTSLVFILQINKQLIFLNVYFYSYAFCLLPLLFDWCFHIFRSQNGCLHQIVEEKNKKVKETIFVMLLLQKHIIWKQIVSNLSWIFQPKYWLGTSKIS